MEAVPRLVGLLLGMVLTHARLGPTSRRRGRRPVCRPHDGHPVVPSFERLFSAPDSDALAGGMLLLGGTELHVLPSDGREGGSLVLHKQAPILDAVGSRVRPEFLRAFLAAPHA